MRGLWVDFVAQVFRPAHSTSRTKVLRYIFTMRSNHSNPFVRGLLAAVPIVVGYLALGIPYGILGVKIGVPPWALVLMSVFILAGSAQFVALQLISAGAGVAPIILAGFVLNLRHLFMAMSLGSALPKVNIPFLTYLAHSITDESYGVNIVKIDGGKQLDPMDMFGTNLVTHASWVLATLLGAYIGNKLPVDVKIASAALPIMFAVLLALQMKGAAHVICAAAAAALTVVLMFWLPGNWSFIAAAVIVPTAATIIPPFPPLEKGGEGGF